MLLVNHKVNTVQQLGDVPPGCGVEVDVRAYGNHLVLHHDPFVEGEEFGRFLEHYQHVFLILNIKCEGIERRAIEMVEAKGINEYFLLDVTFPVMVKLFNSGVRKLAVRYSEYEAIETCLALAGKVDWVFVDNLTRLPVEGFQRLREHFRLCAVSPELCGRNEIPRMRELLERYPVDAVLTDNREAWEL